MSQTEIQEPQQLAGQASAAPDAIAGPEPSVPARPARIIGGNLSPMAVSVILFAVIILGTSSCNFSQTAMNAMLGDVRVDFGVDIDTSQLLTTVYMLVAGIIVPIATYLSRCFSLRNLLFITWGLFGAGAVIDLLTGNFWVLLLGRALQGAATGIAMPVAQAFPILNFPSNRQATAMGIAGIAMGVAPNIGPLVGGAFSDGVGWRWFYALVLGISIVLFVVTALLAERVPNPTNAGRLDVASIAMSTIGFGGILWGCSNASTCDLSSPLVWVPLVIGLISVALFVLRQLRAKRPLIRMSVFESRRFRLGFIMQNTLTGCFMGIPLILPLYVTSLCGGSAIDSGAVFLPAAIAGMFSNPIFGILTDRIGTRPVVLTAGSLLVIGSCSMIFADADTPLWVAAALQGVRAVGISGVVSPLMQWSLSQLPRDVVMDGSTFTNTVRQSFASICASIMVFLVVAVGALFSDPAMGFHLAFGFSGVMAVTTLLLAIFTLNDKGADVQKS